jgi:hypothetical protein
MADEVKDERYLDRYEVVAIVIPGGAFLLFLWYLHPALLGTQGFTLKDISLGSLGFFALASLIAGQFVQAVANIVEAVLNWLADLSRPSPIEVLPTQSRAKVYVGLRRIGIQNPEGASRRRYRKEFNREILRTVRRQGNTRMIDVFNVSYGLNRGLAVACAAGATLAGLSGNWPAASILLGLCIAMFLRAFGASRRFEEELLPEFGDGPLSSSPVP